MIAARDAKRGEEARADISSRSGNRNIELIVAELSTSAGIRSLAEQYLSRHDRLHVLVNNVGGVFQKDQKNAEGMEMTVALNYMAPFLLTHLLLETIKTSAPARIINVASEMQAKQMDMEQLVNPIKYKAMKAYGASKLAVIMFTYTLARKLSGTSVTVNALHPGVIYTPQSARMAPALVRPLMKLLMSSPEKGAEPSLRLATDPSFEGMTGRYYKQMEQKHTSPFSYDEQQQEKLYERSLEWCGLGGLKLQEK